MPTGVFIPVNSMSRRFSIGMVHVFESPGKCSFSSISEMSFSCVIPAGHCSRGLSMTVVSYISSGALSVALSDRPIDLRKAARHELASQLRCQWESDRRTLGHPAVRGRHPLIEHYSIRRRSRSAFIITEKEL